MPDEQSLSLDDVDRMRRPFRGTAGILVRGGWALYLLSMFLPVVDGILGVQAGIIFIETVFPLFPGDPRWYLVMLGALANLFMLVSPLLIVRKSRLGLWISSALMVLPVLYIAAIPNLLLNGFGGLQVGCYVWWLSFAFVAGGLVTRAVKHPAGAPPFSLPRFSLRTLILFTVAFGTFVAAVSRMVNSRLPCDSKLTVITVLMALAALAALIGSIVTDRKQLR